MTTFLDLFPSFRLSRLRLPPHLSRLPRFIEITRSYTSASLPPGLDRLLRVSKEVSDALATKSPVVALETTIYTHGYPYPSNIALASRLESLVRVNGGIPATIGVVNGVATVGMREEEIMQLCATKEAWKISRRDLGFIVGGGLAGRKLHGGTTIAGTMLLAHLAGIRIFATGGLGGVHHGGENTLDISADLTELGRTPVAVISSGCKSFLDIPRTLEYLETQGVGVGTFLDGREEGTKIDFPAFFTRNSGVKSPMVIKDEAEAAAIVYAQTKLPLTSGLLLANPVPVEASLDKEEMDGFIATAIREAEEKGISGAGNTPYILGRIRELSGGRSVEANRALIEGNVVRGTRVAVELAKMEERREETVREQEGKRTESQDMAQVSAPSSLFTDSRSAEESARLDSEPVKDYDIVVVGSLISDTIADYAPFASLSSPATPVPHTSNPSQIKQSPGGVGRNVAVAAHYAGSSVLLTSAVADDIAGTSLLASLKATGMSAEGITTLPAGPGVRTAQYLAINSANKELHLAMSDTSILDHPTLASPDFWSSKLTIGAQSPKWVVVDANWSPNILSTIISAARALPSKPKIAFEPVSTAKASRLSSPSSSSSSHNSNNLTPLLTPSSTHPHSHIFDLITPNALELSALYASFQSSSLSLFNPTHTSSWFRIIDSFALPSSGSRSRFDAIAGPALTDLGIPQQSLQLLPYIPCIVTKLGEQGCLLTRIVAPEEECLRDPEQAGWILGRSASEEAKRELRVGGVYMRLFPRAEDVESEDVKGVNGVGDTLLGVLVAGLVKSGRNVEDLIPAAQMAAVQTLKSEEAVGEGVKQIHLVLQKEWAGIV